MKNLLAYAFLSSFLFAATAFAQKATIQGDAGDANGRPLPNAQVRIQSSNAKSGPVMVKTNKKGHFTAGGLPAGTYTVAVLVDGAVKWSAANVKAVNGREVYLKLSGKQVAVATSASNTQPKKRAVWVPDQVGSRLGGHYEDQPYQGPPQDGLSGMGSEQLRQLQNTNLSRPSGGGQ